MCSFTTSVHNPFLEERMEDLPQHVVIPLQKQIQRVGLEFNCKNKTNKVSTNFFIFFLILKGEMMNNKQFGETVKWNEEYKFLKNIP